MIFPLLNFLILYDSLVTHTKFYFYCRYFYICHLQVKAWEIACASGRRVCWGVVNWYIVGTVELGMMYKSQKIGGSISRELLVLKEVHLKSTQFERRSNLYNKLLKYLTGILSWEMKILFFLYLIYIWITNLF